MNVLYARTVFFVADIERSLRYYTEELGFAMDWNSNDGVLQVSLLGFELILNQVGESSRTRAGHGRVFIGLEEVQEEPFRKHITDRRIPTFQVEWGRPTLVIKDPDDNELFFWPAHGDFGDLGISSIASSESTDIKK